MQPSATCVSRFQFQQHSGVPHDNTVKNSLNSGSTESVTTCLVPVQETAVTNLLYPVELSLEVKLKHPSRPQISNHKVHYTVFLDCGLGIGLGNV